mgnify:FL=1
MHTISIEACLELIAGFSENKITKPFILLDRDKKLIIDIAKKVYKGYALTDRQYEVVKRILINRYASQFKARNIDIQNSANQLRKPIRVLDRTRYIRIEDGSNYLDPIWAGYTPKKVVVVRFPFNMILTKLIQDTRKLFPDLITRFYNQRLKDKYLFPFNERVIYKLIGRFKGRMTEVDPILLDIYNKIDVMQKNPDNHIPGIYKNKFSNISPQVTEKHTKLFGEPNTENLFKFWDRRDHMGIKKVDEQDLQESCKNLTVLSKKIIKRTQPFINIDTTKWQLEQVVETLLELDRFPLLVVLPHNDFKSLELLREIHSLLKNVVASEDVSVMHRRKNLTDSGKDYNDYIHEQKINNALANNTKIVYITNKKVPKPLVKSDWRPSTVICMDDSRSYTKVDSFIHEFDLVFQINGQNNYWNSIHYDTETI